MKDTEYIKKLEKYLNNCSKEDLEKVYKDIQKNIIEHIEKAIDY